MNISNKRWLKFKQELPSIALLSVIQLWEGFYFPNNIMNLESPWSIFYFILRSLFGVFLIVFLFSSMDELASNLKLEFIKDTPYASAATNKKIAVSAMITGFSVVMFFTWYMDFYGMSNLRYILFFATWILTIALIYRAAYRVDSKS